MTPRHVRALRGSAAAGVATLVAAVSHTLAGGGAPSPALVVVIGILAAPVAILLIGRRLSLWRVGAVVVASQSLFHTAFAVTAGVDSAAIAGHVHHVSLDGSSASGGLLPSGPMLVAHLLAAVVTVLALFSGERMLRALGRGIRSLLRRADAPSPAPVGLVPAVPAAHPSPPGGWGVVLSDLSRRGPPSFVLAVS